MDLYAGPVGLANQIHDFNPHIDANDVFWTVPVPHDSVEVDFDDAHAILRVTNLPVFDDHDLANSLTSGMGLNGDPDYPYPHIPSVAPRHATVSFELEWMNRVATATIHNAAQRFKGSFIETDCTIRWSANEPGFSFESEAPNPARSLFAVFGREQNGVFFT
jgi:hypothetical protein